MFCTILTVGFWILRNDEKIRYLYLICLQILTFKGTVCSDDVDWIESGSIGQALVIRICLKFFD
jgi:hypothetical protein